MLLNNNDKGICNEKHAFLSTAILNVNFNGRKIVPIFHSNFGVQLLYKTNLFRHNYDEQN